MNLVSLESLLIHPLDNAQISIFSKVDIMYLLLYWVTYSNGHGCVYACPLANFKLLR